MSLDRLVDGADGVFGMDGKVYSVTQLTASIRKNLLSNNPKIADVWIEGEVSGLKTYSSGHRYFILKDKDAQISCVLFSFRVSGCDDGVKAVLAKGDAAVNGLKVQMMGELDLNMSRGQYSFKIEKLRLAGLGERMAQFNALKKKLEDQGLNKLDHPELRRPLPFLPHRIGIVTSPSGAVIHDMCTVLTRRFPNIEIRLFPVKVQGDEAVQMIAGGIRFFNSCDSQDWRPDLIIVGRGGGSVEDLWAFNEEPVVYAVAESAIPVISAVGHESDVTLCDHVADLRAGTPSIAAERAVPVKSELMSQVNDLAERLHRVPLQVYETLMQQIDYLSLKVANSPKEMVSRAEMRLQRAVSSLRLSICSVVERPLARIGRFETSLAASLRASVERSTGLLREQAARLELLNPFAVLGRGYTITLDSEGHVVRSVTNVAAGERMCTRFADGSAVSVVENAVPG